MGDRIDKQKGGHTVLQKQHIFSAIIFVLALALAGVTKEEIINNIEEVFNNTEV